VHGALEVVEGPLADAGLVVRRDVGRVDDAEGRVDGQAAGELLGFRISVPTIVSAIRKLRKIISSPAVALLACCTNSAAA
jgi:hypothetical protein